VSQTEIYSDEMALPMAVTEPPPVNPEDGRPRLGPRHLGRVAAAESISVR